MNKAAALAATLVIGILLTPIGYAGYSVTINPGETCKEDKVHWSTHVDGEHHEVRVYNWGNQTMKYAVKLSGTGEPYAEVTSSKYFTLKPGEREKVAIYVEPTEGYSENERYELEVKASFYIEADGSVHQAGAKSCYNIEFTGNRSSPLKQETTRVSHEAPEKLRVSTEEVEGALVTREAAFVLVGVLAAAFAVGLHSKKSDGGLIGGACSA